MLTADFVAAVRRQASLTAQSTDADILAWGDQEVRGHYMPLLRAMRAEYGVRRVTLPSANGRCVMPDRAQVAGIRLVQWVYGSTYVNLPQLGPEDDTGDTGSTTPYGFYFDAAGINLIPSAGSGTFRVWYYQQPASMILSSVVAQTSEILTYSETPTMATVTFNPLTIIANGDVVSARPSHHTVLGGIINASGSGSSNYQTLIYPLVDGDRPVPKDEYITLEVGDWVAPNGRTPFVPLPEELSSALVHRTGGTILRALGYLNESAAALELAGEAEAKARVLLAPRSEGNSRFLTGSIASSLGRRW